MNEERTIRTTPDTRIVTLGLGEWIVGSSIDMGGCPGISYSPAPTPGTPGTSAGHLVEDGPLVDGSVLIQFASMEAIIQHLERLMILVQELEQSTVDNPPDSV